MTGVNPAKFDNLRLVAALALLIVLAATSGANYLTAQPDTSQAAELMQAADSYYDQERFDSAEINYQASAAIYKKREIWPRYIDASIGLCETYFRNLKLDKAEARISETLITAKSKIPAISLLMSHILDCRGNIFIWQGKFNQSLEDLRKSLDIKQQLENVSIHDLARTYDYLGDAYRNLDQMNPAVECYSKMLSLYESSDSNAHHVNVSKALSDLAILSRKRGEFELALQQYQRALQILELQKEDDPHALGAILNGIGVIYATTGRYPAALEYFNRLLANDLKFLPSSHPDLAKVYTNLGILHELMGDFKQSVTLHEKALNIKSKSLGPDNPSLIYDYKGLAQVHINIGDVEQTLLYAHKTEQLEIEHIGPESRNLAMSYLIIGSAYKLKREYARALNYLRKSENIIRSKDPFDPQIGPIYHNISTLFTSKTQYDSAIFYAKKALLINQKNFGNLHPHVAGNLSTLGQNYQLLNNLSRAENYYREALDISLEVDGPQHQNTVNNYINLAENLRLAERLKESLTYSQLALIAGTNNFQDTAISTNPIAEQTRLPRDIAVALAGKGKALRDLFLRTDNLAYLESAAKAFTRSSEMISEAQFSYKSKGSVALLKHDLASIYESALEVCHLLFENTQQEDHIDRALQFAEQGKATLLLAALNESRARRFAGIPPELLESENNLRRDLTYFEQQLIGPNNSSQEQGQVSSKIFELKSQYDSLVATLEAEYPKYHRLKFNDSVISLADLKENLLESDEALIEFYVGEKNIYTIVVSSDHSDFLQTPYNVAISDQIFDLISSLKETKTNSIEFSELSYRLFQLLLEPIGVEKLKRKLILVPDGILNYLPFETLTISRKDSLNYFSLPYLFVEHSISYAYSATFLQDIRSDEAVHSKKNNFLAFAPTFEDRNRAGEVRQINIESTQSTYRDQLAELTGAMDEVRSLSQHFEGRFHQGGNATETVFKDHAERFSILHLATHAIIDNVNPLNSKLLFSASEDSIQDADLHAWELYNMDLRARLAVLSACNTGFGKIQKGEGVLSLGRAFAYAGCPSVLMSLWPAQDQSTTKVMSMFYKYLAKGFEKDEALRKSKLEYIRTSEDYNAHPFYWAGFILQGSHEALSRPFNLLSSWYTWASCAAFLLLIALYRQISLSKTKTG